MVWYEHRGVLAYADKNYDALSYLEQARDICLKIGHKHVLLEVSVTLGKVNLALGNIQETLHHSQVLLETATEVGNKEYAGKALRLLGIGLWEQGDTREGKKRFEESLRTLEEVENKTELGKTCYELGQRLMRQKEHRPEGRAYLERAASIFKRIGTEKDLEQVMEVIAT